MPEAFGPRKPLFGPYTYRVKQNYNGDTLLAVYVGSKRIAHMDAYWLYSMRTVEDREEEVQKYGRGRACASDLRALGAEGKYPNVLSVSHAFITDDAHKGKGVGRAMYEAMMAEGFAVRESRTGGKPGPMFFIPDECKGVGNTSAEARRVWASLVRDYLSKGTSIRVDAPPVIGSRAPRTNPRRSFSTEKIPSGTILYHGTQAEEPFEQEGRGTPDGPAWFTNHRSAAEYFARDWHDHGGDARILVYKVTRAIPKIATVRDKPTFAKVLRHIGLDPDEVVAGMEEIRDAMGSQRDLNGWRIHNNYQPGDDILISEPETYLRLVRVEVL